MWNSVRRLSTMTCLNLSFPGSLLSHFRGVQLTVKAQVRCISQGVFRTDSSPRPARSLSSRSVLSVPSLYLQPCSTRRVSQAGSGSGWYASVADSAPVHFTEQLLISSQQMTALPWWAGIICTTVALRTVITLPLAVYQATIIAKIEALQKEIAELAQRLRYEISVRAKEKGWSEKTCRYHFKKNLRRIVSELYVRDNCHPFKASLLVWVQLPMWVSVSLALRNISVGLEHAPSGLQQQLAAGGALWFPDLTVPDSTWIIPVSLGLINLLITEVHALSKLEQSKFQKYVTNFIRGISLVMIPLAATVPSSMALYWLSSSSIGLAHNLLLRSPRFRALCRIPPSHSDSQTPYRDIAAAFVTKYMK
ncbi:cytochrome c oxidase assembly protein COX18, mitochondrial [Tachysurus vachellii]|uniref:cytochrome c oxidase assembly protein COX18, mitochondrial n=1 Tax=Tachysurus vachellii TaxID=175792 RepID=UPI00296AB5AA|nr:cytochrome c oxidase assembly protein COX18, mitochondrial [Tachysurus vachellii]